MRNRASIKFIYSIFIILSFMYILLLFNIALSHYMDIIFKNGASLEETLLQYNWKYWFELNSYNFSYFASFLEYLDNNYLHTQGIILLLSNFIFLFLLVYLLYKIIHTIFSKFENSKMIEVFLIFATIILIFSALQDEPIVWMFNQQIFAGYYFVLLSYYFLIKYVNTKNTKELSFLIISSVFVIFTTSNSYLVLIILILVSLFVNINWFSRLSIIAIFILSIFIYYNNILSYINDIGKIIDSSSSLFTILKYILTYLGSVFVYMSYEPCFATSAILGGVFIFGTFLFLSYLLFTKRVKENFMWVIWSYLLYYIFNAFTNLNKMANSNIVLFSNKYITPSLIAWTLIVIFYIYYFYNNKLLLRRLLVVFLTFVSVLYIYQIKSYLNNNENKNNYKLAIYALKNGINDQYLLEKVSNLIYILSYKSDKTQLTMFTLYNIKQKIIKDKIKSLNKINLFANLNVNKGEYILLENNNKYKGSIDKIKHIKSDIYSITGWIYDLKSKKIPSALFILDKNTIIGYIIPHLPRRDVEKVYGYKSLRSGFKGYLKSTKLLKTLYLYNIEKQEIIKAIYKN